MAKKFKFLYQIMHDDLKDANMIIHYACELKEDAKDLPIADELAKYAQFRLNHAAEMDKHFKTEMAKMDVGKNEVTRCLWDQTYDYMMEWYRMIEEKIKNY